MIRNNNNYKLNKLRAKLLIKAVMCNWDEIGPGDWTEVTWQVFSDGSYKIIYSFNPTFEEDEGLPSAKNKITTGKMWKIAFARLKRAIKREPWRDPSIYVEADDGVAWTIVSYNENGTIGNTSGELDYIYGQRVLEAIVKSLPKTGNLYCNSAYVSVAKREL